VRARFRETCFQGGSQCSRTKISVTVVTLQVFVRSLFKWISLRREAQYFDVFVILANGVNLLSVRG
jgi:hypothetical protein